MADIFCGRGVDGVFRDVRSVIAHPLEMARDEHQIQITTELVRILGHALNQTPARAWANIGSMKSHSGSAGWRLSLRALRAMLTAWSAMRSRFELSFIAETTRRRSDATGWNRRSKSTPSLSTCFSS